MLDGDNELLREPTLTLTLPSIHDGTTLDCRVYHPFSLSISPKAPAWQKHAAIVAHPYAPLGGSCDDHIVDVVASTLLRLGYLVCTFNFRYFYDPDYCPTTASNAQLTLDQRGIWLGWAHVLDSQG